jgi:hypothetical protein
MTSKDGVGPMHRVAIASFAGTSSSTAPVTFLVTTLTLSPEAFRERGWRRGDPPAAPCR